MPESATTGWVRVVIEAILVLIALGSIGVAWGVLEGRQTSDDAIIKTRLVPELRQLDLWRTHLDDYLEYKDPDAKAFLEHSNGDPPVR